MEEKSYEALCEEQRRPYLQWLKNMSGRLIASGMAALIGFQSFINIGVATEFLPNTGLPLPFVSYGLTSLLSYMAGIGIVLNIGLQRHY